MVRENILIVSANFKKAYPIIRSVNKLGYRTIGGFYAWRSPVFSRYLNKRYKISNPYIDSIAYVKQLLHIIKKEGPIMIIPVGFIDNLILSKYKYVFPKKIIIPVPDFSSFKIVSNKAKLA